MFIALFFLLVIFLLALDLPFLWQEGFNKDLIVYALFWLAALYLSAVQLFHWPFFNPLLFIAQRLQGG